MENPNQKRYIVLSLILLSFGMVWIWVSRLDPSMSILPQIPQKNFPAPNLVLPGFDGKTYDLKSHRGQVVILNFWATWCPPCRAEMPAMEEVHQKYKEAGLQILAVDNTSNDSLSSVANFISEYQITFPVLLDEKGFAINEFKVQALPTTYFIDRDGIIREVIYGGPMSHALLQTRVEQLLNSDN